MTDDCKNEILELLEKYAGGLASKEEILDMIENGFIAGDNLISIDHNDVLQTIKGMSEIDAASASGLNSDLYAMLKDAISRISAAHGGKAPSSLLITFHIPRDGNFMIGHMDGMNQCLDEIEGNPDIIWGVVNVDGMAADDVKIFLMTGFKD